MNQTHQINESHLGTEGTPEQARQMAEILTAMGYPSEYNSMQGVSTARKNQPGEDIEIPESVWMAALAKIV
jgi:hypothetical protein